MLISCLLYWLIFLARHTYPALEECAYNTHWRFPEGTNTFCLLPLTPHFHLPFEFMSLLATTPADMKLRYRLDMFASISAII